MMRIQWNNMEYAICFSHNPQTGSRCVVLYGKPGSKDEEKVECSRGTALLAPEDLNKFNKAVGRQISLGRAVSEFPKELRTVIWNEFKVPIMERTLKQNPKYLRRVIAALTGYNNQMEQELKAKTEQLVESHNLITELLGKIEHITDTPNSIIPIAIRTNLKPKPEGIIPPAMMVAIEKRLREAEPTERRQHLVESNYPD